MALNTLKQDGVGWMERRRIGKVWLMLDHARANTMTGRFETALQLCRDVIRIGQQTDTEAMKHTMSIVMMTRAINMAQELIDEIPTFRTQFNEALKQNSDANG